MSNYFRITAYHPKEEVSVILDSNGKFEKLWQFSAHLVAAGFKIIAVGNSDKLVDGTCPLVNRTSDKIMLRAAYKGEPETGEMDYNNRHCKTLAVYDKIYGQYTD